jgi:hypothetical protein
MNLYDTVNEAKNKAIKKFVKGLTVLELLQKMDETFKDNVRCGLKLSTTIYLDFYNTDLDEIGSTYCDYETVKGFIDKDEELLRDNPKFVEFLDKKVINLVGYRDPEIVNGFNDGMPYGINHYLNIVVE